MKKTLLLKTLLLLCAIIVGSTSVKATDYNEYYKINCPKNSSNSAYGTYYNVTISGMEWNAPGNQNIDGGWRIGGKRENSKDLDADRTITGKSEMGSAITKIAFNHKGISRSSVSVSYVKLTVASDANFENVIDEINVANPSVTSGTAATIEFAPTTPLTEWAKDCYYKFTIHVKNTNTSNGGLDLTSIVFYNSGGGEEPAIATPTFSPEEGAVTAGTEITISTTTDGAKIYYTTDETTPTAESTFYDGAIAVTTPTTIKAIAIKDDAVSSVATASYTINVTSPAFSLEGGSYLEGTKVTITSAGNTIYYTTDGSTPTASSTQYTEPIAIAAGKKSYKAIAVDAYGNTSGVVTRTYTGITPATLPFSWTGTSDKGKDDLAGQTGVVLNLGGDYAASNAPYRLKFDGTIDKKYVIIYTNEKPENVYFTAKLFNAANTGSKMKVQASTDGLEFTDIEEFTIKGSANATFEFTTTNAFAANHRVIKIGLSSKDQNVGVGTICASAIPATIPANKEWITFCSPYNLDFTSDIAGLEGAYTITAHENQATTLTATKMTGKVKAGTGLLLHIAEPKTTAQLISIPVAATGEEQADNMLKGVTEDTEIAPTTGEYTNLGLKDGEFHPYTNGPSDMAKLAAGKAYLQIPTAQMPTGGNNARLYIVLDGEATGINAIENSELRIENLDAPMYNLAGQRVTKSYKGVVIVNGKKFINK